MLTKRKKIFILVSMVGLLVVTGWLNIMLNTWTRNNPDPPVVGQLSFFARYRQDRITSRNQTALHLDSIINNPNSTPEAVANALRQREELAMIFETERVLEGLIMAQGFEDAIVTNTTTNINVIVQASEITATQANAILTIVKEETGADPTTIRLMTV